MQTHACTIMVWLESMVVSVPLSAVGRGGECFKKRLKLNDFFLCSGPRGLEKRRSYKGGVICFTSVGSGGI